MLTQLNGSRRDAFHKYGKIVGDGRWTAGTLEGGQGVIGNVSLSRTAGYRRELASGSQSPRNLDQARSNLALALTRSVVSKPSLKDP